MTAASPPGSSALLEAQGFRRPVGEARMPGSGRRRGLRRRRPRSRPAGHGWPLRAEAWRANGRTLPVLVLTARGTWSDGSRVSTPVPTTICPSRSAWRNCWPVCAHVRGSAGHASSLMIAGDVARPAPDEGDGTRRAGRAVATGIPAGRLSDAAPRPRGVAARADENVYGQARTTTLTPWRCSSAGCARVGPGLIETRRGFGYLVPEAPRRAGAPCDCGWRPAASSPSWWR